MSSTFSISAEFENIDSPELIASALYLLQREGWRIKNFNDSYLNAEKSAVGNDKVSLTISINRKEVVIECKSELAQKANQHIVEALVNDLQEFISAPNFDNRVRELKHSYFMGNPVTQSQVDVKQPREQSEFEAIFSFRKSFRVTPALLILNVGIFIIMVITGVSLMNPSIVDMLNWGANLRTLVLEGQWWRLITCCFLHYGPIHLAFNMWALYSIGMFLERMIGSWRFGFAYVIAGLAGSLNSIAWNPATTSAGASGAIFGMFGLFLALLTTNILEKGFRTAMLKSIVPMILFNLLIGTAAMIDNAGHIGGLLAGLVCGYLYSWHYKFPRSKVVDVLSFVIPVLFILASICSVNKYLPDPFGDYEKVMDKIKPLEQEALELQVQEQNTKTIKRSEKLWGDMAKEMEKAAALKLRPDIDERNEQLLYYFQKRNQQYKYLIGNKDSILFYKARYSADSVFKILNTKEE